MFLVPQGEEGRGCAMLRPWPPRRRDSWLRLRSGGNTSAGPSAPSGNVSGRRRSGKVRRSARTPETSNPACLSGGDAELFGDRTAFDAAVDGWPADMREAVRGMAQGAWRVEVR